jgi:hypothetical protein
MRWHNIPHMEGLTDPHGTISSPYSGFGISGPLRLAPSQPALVGEDLGLFPGPKPSGPSRPGPAPGPKPGGGPQKPGPPGPVIKPVYLRERRLYGELAPAPMQMDANFSTSPTQISSQATTVSKQGWGDLGGHMVASNHYDGLGQVEYESRRSAPAAIASVLTVFRQAGKKAGLDTAAAISVREGIPVTEAAIEVISTKKMGADDLERRIAKLEAAASVAKSRGQRNKHKRYRIRLAALRARLADVNRGRKQAMADDPAIAGDKGRIPAWVTWAGLGLGAASLFLALRASGQKRKTK